MDIHITNKDGSFKFRVCGIVKCNDKILVVKMHDNPFYCLPGGHVEIGESTIDACDRELREELGYEVNVDNLALIMENFFKRFDGNIYHELAYYYTCSPKNIQDINFEDTTIFENDKGLITKLEFKWVDENELKNIEFRPKKIQNIIFEDFKSPKYIISKE